MVIKCWILMSFCIIIMRRGSNWCPKEDQILRETIQRHTSKRWVRASNSLLESGFRRTNAQCRERYINYLAPNIDKETITSQELRLLYENYHRVGSRWAVIQESIPHKTQCKIKNVFYGNIKNALKTIYKFFTLKTASFFNSLPTQHLQELYDGTADFAGHHQIRQAVKVMGYRNNKGALLRHLKTHHGRYLVIINLVLTRLFDAAPLKPALSQKHMLKVDQVIKKRVNHGDEQPLQISDSEDEIVNEEPVRQEDPNPSQQSQQPPEDKRSEPCEPMRWLEKAPLTLTNEVPLLPQNPSELSIPQTAFPGVYGQIPAIWGSFSYPPFMYMPY